MSEHAWTQDNLAAHVAGGLDAGERERLERHLAECFDCASALENARAADRRLLALFKGVQPGPALEDRLIRSLRQGAARKRPMPGLSGPWVKVVLATAAAALLAVVGAGISTVIEKDGLFAAASPEAAGSVPEVDRSATTYYSRFIHGSANQGRNYVLEGRDEGGVPKGSQQSTLGLGTGSMVSFDGPPGSTTYTESPTQGQSPEKLAQQLRAESPFALLDGRDKGKPGATTKAEKTKEMKVPSSSMNESDQKLKAHRDVNASVPMPAPNAAPDQTTNSKPGAPGALLNGSYTARVSPYLNMTTQSTALPPIGPKPAGVDLGYPIVVPQMPSPKAESLNTNQVVGNGYFNNSPSSTSGSSTGTPKHTFDDMRRDEKKPVGDGFQAPAKDAKEAAAEKKLSRLEYFYNPDSTFKELDRESKPGDKSEKSDEKGFLEKLDAGRGKNVTEAGKTDPKEPPGKTAPPAQPKAPELPEPVVQKVIIRSGDIEFVVDSFDSGVLIIQKLIAATKGGYVGTINSDKLPNGKVFGSVVVRVPPEQLDKLILDLRQQLGKIGELKGQRIGSRDITKEFTDLQSRLKAARTMEERLLSIIKSEKGQIKDLLMAEKELGVWRTKIEELTGELNYYANLASLSTLTITMSEKELRVAASVSESERVRAGIEVEDVEKAMRDVLKSVDDAKGRVTRSELKQQSAGQFNAILTFEVSPDGAGPVRDRLKQLGTVTRFEVDRVQEAENGDKLPMDGKLHRGNTRFEVSLYNVFSIAPRETATVRIYVTDVAAAYRELREKVIEAKGRILDANLSEQDRQNVIAHMDFDVKRANEGAIQTALAAAGELLNRQVVRAPAGANVTDTKVLYRVDLVANVPARETVTMRLAAPDVAAAYAALRKAVADAKGRMSNTNFNELDKTNVGAQIDFDVKRSEQAAIQTALETAGEVLSRTVVRAAEGDNVTDTKVHFSITLAGNVQPRDIVTVRLAALDVPVAYATLREVVAKAKGRVVNANFDEKDPKNVGAQLDFDVRRSDEATIQLALSGAGEVLSRTVTRLPEGNNVTDTKVFFKVEFAGNVQPRDTVTVRLAALDVPVAYAALREVVAKAKGRVLNANFDEKDPKTASAQLDFDVRRSEEAAIQLALSGAGEVLSRTVARLPEGNNVTDAKVFFSVMFAANVQPRETVTIKIAATDVAAAHRALRTVVAQAKARILSANLDEKDRQNVDADLDFDVRRTEEGVVQTALNEAGAVLSRHVSRITSGENYTDARVLFKVKLVPASNIEPREVYALAIEVTDVEREESILTAQVKEVQGRVVNRPMIVQERSGRWTAHVVYDVPLVMAGGIVDKVKNAGTVRVREVAPNPQAPEGKLALARIDVTFTNGDVLVPRDDGLTVQVRSGLASSLQGLFWSVKFLIIGLLFVLPWLLLIYAMIWLGRRMWRPAVLASAGLVPTEAPAPPQ